MINVGQYVKIRVLTESESLLMSLSKNGVKPPSTKSGWSGWGASFTNSYKESIWTGEFYWKQTSDTKIDVIYLEKYPVEPRTVGPKKGYFVKVLTSDTPLTDIIQTSKELKEYRLFPENHNITFCTTEELAEMLKNKTLTTFSELENAINLPIEPQHDWYGNTISEGDYLWVLVNKNSPDRETYISIIFIEKLFPKGKALIKKPNANGKKGDGRLSSILRGYRKFHPNHPINNMPYDWAEELLLGKTFREEKDLDTILNS